MNVHVPQPGDQELAASVNRSRTFGYSNLLNLPDMTVVIVGDRIVAIGKVKKVRIPKGSRSIDARSKFLIPGLWDMHVHIGTEAFDRDSYLSLFVANGVTGIRIMAGAPQHHFWRKEVEAGSL